jgi:hypothetical protein
MKRSDDITEIAKAMNACQGELKDVFKGTQGYGYKYASLDKVYDEVRPKMTKHGLSLTHQKSFNRENSCIELTSLLMHESGQWIEYHGSLPFASMKQMNDYQASGSGFTYLERYQTSAIFGITSDEDNDAAGEQDDSITKDQVMEVEALIAEVKADRKALLDYFKVAALEVLTVQQYRMAVAMLNKKKGA